MLLHILCNTKINHTKNSVRCDGSGTVMKGKETVERERVKAWLHWGSLQKLCWLPRSKFSPNIFYLSIFSLIIKHCVLKAFTLINPDVTSACFTDIVVSNWHRASQLVTDITDQPSYTGNESAPKSFHVLFRYVSKRPGRHRVWPVGIYFGLYIFTFPSQTFFNPDYS